MTRHLQDGSASTTLLVLVRLADMTPQVVVPVNPCRAVGALPALFRDLIPGILSEGAMVSPHVPVHVLVGGEALRAGRGARNCSFAWDMGVVRRMLVLAADARVSEQ